MARTSSTDPMTTAGITPKTATPDPQSVAVPA